MARLEQAEFFDEPTHTVKSELTRDEILLGAHLIPNNWRWTVVGEIGAIRLGKQLTPARKDGGNATQYIRAANITWNGLELDDVLEMSFTNEERKVYALRSGDIVLSEASGSPKEVGKPAIWRNDLPLCCFQNTVIRFRPYLISTIYAYYVFRHFAENGVFMRLLRGVGINHLGVDKFSKIPVPLPPMQEQHRIGARVDALFARLTRSHHHFVDALQKIERGKFSAVENAFSTIVPRLKNQSNAEEPWTTCKLRDIVKTTNGRAFKSSEWENEGLPIIRIQNLKDAKATFHYYSGDIDKKHIIHQGDLLFAWSGTPGSSFGAFLWNGPMGALNQHIFKLSFDEKIIDKHFLLHSLNRCINTFISSAKGGGGLAHVPKNVLLETLIELPPLEIQRIIARAIVTNIESFDKQEQIVNNNLDRLESLRQSILCRAVQGKLVQRTDDSTIDQLLIEISRERSRIKEEDSELAKFQAKLSHNIKFSRQSKNVRSLIDVLREFGPMKADELFKKIGYKAGIAEDVNHFYDEISLALRNNQICTDESIDPTQALWQILEV